MLLKSILVRNTSEVQPPNKQLINHQPIPYNLTPVKQKRILTKIEKLKKALRQEKARFKAYHDGGGYRYAIAELYFQLKDYKKTNRYLNWFDKNFPSDGKYPYYLLGEAVTKFEVGKISEAKVATIGLNRQNTYLIDLLIDNEIEDQNKYEWTPAEQLDWAKEQLSTHLNLCTEGYLNWLKEFSNKQNYQDWYSKLISIKQQLKGMEVSEERTALLESSRKCIDDWKLDCK